MKSAHHLAVVFLLTSVGRFVGAESPAPAALVKQHCAECHSGEKPKGDVRLDPVAFDPADAKTRAIWEKAYAMLVRGEMPPDEKPRLTTDELETLTTWIHREIERGAIADRGAAGRTTMRRLTRVEYARLLQDVLGLHFANVPLKLHEKLPNDPQTEAPLNDGDLLAFQSLHLKASADLVEKAVKAVLSDEPRPEPFTYRIDPQSLATANIQGRINGLTGQVPPNESDNKARLARVTIGSADRTGSGGVLLSPIYRADSYLGRDKINVGSWNIELPYFQPVGVLHLKIRAGAVIPLGEGAPVMRVSFYNNVDNERFGRELAAITVTNPADDLQDYEVEIPLDLIDFPYVLFERSGRIGLRIANDYMPLADRSLPPREKGTPEVWPWEEPQLVIDEVFISGPGASRWPPRRHAALTAVGERFTDERERAAAILQTLAAKAWRRPVVAAEIASFVQLYQQRRTDGQSHDGALLEPLTAVLVSPHAHYLVELKAETPAPLSGVELANRLSIFLWGSGPDHELLDLATAGKLQDPQVLAAQVNRMLDAPRGQVFAEDFVTRMLVLERVENDPIDFGLTLKSISNSKVADLREERLKHDLAREPVRYFEHVLRSNRSAYELIGSDYLIVNDRLARYYGIAGVDGQEFRQISAPEDRQGGWLTMAGVVAAASRGNKEATILRGVYLLDRILGEHPGTPPGNVEPLEVQAKADAKRGRLSIREQVALHTSINTCALCHRKIDPLGFAWAEFNYLGQKLPVQPVQANKPAMPIDCSGKLPDGRAFADLKQFAQLLHDQDGHHQTSSRFRFGDVLVRRLTGYALSRPLNLSDEELIRDLVQTAERDGWRLREIIKSIVLTKSFTQG